MPDIVLSTEQIETGALLRQLLGGAFANRYLDFCKLCSDAIQLHSTRPLAAHALRELDGLLRAVLASPLDAVVRDDPDEKARRRKAATSLRQLGFDDEARQRAERALQPQLNFRKQVARILNRLSFAPGSDIETKWMSLQGALKQVHRRTFDKSLRVDDEFRQQLTIPFDAVIRAVVIALRERFASLLERAAEIAAMEPAAGIGAFVAEIPGAAQLQRHFFDRLTKEDWLPLLQERGLLGEPMFPKEEDDTGFRQWPVSRYLLRMAKSENPQARAIVINAIKSLASTVHPDVQHDAMEIVSELPANEAAMLADVVAGWLKPGIEVFLSFPPTIIKNLARAGEVDAALALTEAQFQVFGDEGRLTTLYGHLMYEHFLPDVAKELTEAAPLRAVELFSRLLRTVAVLTGRLDNGNAEDNSCYVVADLDGIAAYRDVPAVLAGAVIEAAAHAVQAARSQTADVIQIIRAHDARLFELIAMRVVAMSPAAVPELAISYLSDETLIDESWCRKEYAGIANVWFAALDSDLRRTILDFIYAIPDSHQPGWNEWFQSAHSRTPTERETREYRFTTVRDIVWDWRNALPSERRAELDEGTAEFGGPEDWRHRYDRAAQSPLSSAEMKSQSIEDTIAFLRAWRPDPADDDGDRKTSALAHELRVAASEDPVAYSLRATEFDTLRPIFLRRFLEAMEQAAMKGVPISWTRLFELTARVCRGKEFADLDDRDQERYRILKLLIELASGGLRAGISHEHASDLRPLARSFYDLSLTAMAPAESQPRSSDHLYHQAQQTVRGAAVEFCILSMRWSRMIDDGRDPTPAAAAVGDEARMILDKEIADRSTAGDAGRAIIGRHLNLLYRLEQPWLRSRAHLLFPPERERVWQSTWLSHLKNDAGPLDGLITETAFCYAHHIEALAKSAPSDDRNALAPRLTDYLLTLHIRGTLPDGLLERFLTVAPVALRRDGMRLIGQTIGLPPERCPPAMNNRARSYWQSRLAAAKAASDPSQYRVEIGAIGVWFLWITDVDWLMEQLLELSRAGYAPNDVYTVIRHIAMHADDDIDRVVEVLHALATGPQSDRYALMVQTAEIRKMLVVGKRAGSEATSARVVSIVNVLASKGNEAYLDLLEDEDQARS